MINEYSESPLTKNEPSEESSNTAMSPNRIQFELEKLSHLIQTHFQSPETSSEPTTQDVNRTALSYRETKILKFLALGNTKREIAGLLGMSYGTVAKDTEHIIKKFSARNVTAAVAIGIRQGVIQ